MRITPGMHNVYASQRNQVQNKNTSTTFGSKQHQVPEQTAKGIRLATENAVRRLGISPSEREAEEYTIPTSFGTVRLNGNGGVDARIYDDKVGCALVGLTNTGKIIDQTNTDGMSDTLPKYLNMMASELGSRSQDPQYVYPANIAAQYLGN